MRMDLSNQIHLTKPFHDLVATQHTEGHQRNSFLAAWKLVSGLLAVPHMG